MIKVITNKLAFVMLCLVAQLAESMARTPLQAGMAEQVTAAANTDTFSVAAVLQSNMVVQQAKPFRIWGVAPAGSEVQVSASWSNKSIRTIAGSDHRWVTEIPVPEAVPGDFTPHRIRISHQDTIVELKEVVIGEVWVCSGQSNMTYMLDSIPGWGPGVPDFRQEKEAAHFPNIRLMTVGMALEDLPVDDVKGTWKVCSPETVGSFSAVAYYFGRRLFNHLNVPIGLVMNGIPGAAEQTFTSRQVLEADTMLKRYYIDRHEANPRQEGEYILTTLQRPCLIYNGMIHPIRQLSIRGVIWYQGESNRNDGMRYDQLSKAMLAGWRKDFDQGAFPFYFVQMPPYTWQEELGSSNYALFREVQEALLSVENTGMIITMDVGDPNDLHPRNKRPVGERLATLALNKTYGRTEIRSQGPRFKSYETLGDVVKVTFALPIGALTTSDGMPPTCFYLAGEDRIFHPAEARLRGNQVSLRADNVTAPKAIRYAFTNASLTNLVDTDGLPVAPFRTDDWDEAETIVQQEIQFSLASVLQPSMVIQQEKPFRLWGTAPPGDTVRLQAGWDLTISRNAIADSVGIWIGEVDVPTAIKGNFEPTHIQVTHGGVVTTLNDLLIGDVWLCAGQSNMDMMVGKVEGWYPGVVDYEKEIAEAIFPAIRLFKAHAGFNLEPQAEVKGSWLVCSPESVGGFSAVAYFFGRELHRILAIPIGLVVSAVPGASGQAFTPVDVLASNSQLKEKYLDPFRSDLQSQKRIDSFDFFYRVTRPTLIYNAMIHPLENLSLKGFVWYQGESNHAERESYTKLCAAMLDTWRTRFGQGDLPFYFTQIAPYMDKLDTTGTKSAYFREAQEAILAVKHTGMAVTMDVGEMENVHPREKKSVGKRLAALAFSDTYGLDVVCGGPSFSNLRFVGKKARLSFKPGSLGSGLTTSDGKAARHFLVAGPDRKFFPATVKIKGDHIWLKSNLVKRPTAVRYAFSNTAITNFQNKEGFPAIPFRTDDWDHASVVVVEQDTN